MKREILTSTVLFLLSEVALAVAPLIRQWAIEYQETRPFWFSLPIRPPDVPLNFWMLLLIICEVMFVLVYIYGMWRLIAKAERNNG